jgi:hypothetical protein
MNAEEKKNVEFYYEGLTKKDLKEELAQLDGQLGQAQIRANMDSVELNALLIREKKAQIQKAMELYGQINVTEGIEQAFIQLTKIQGMEAASRADLINLEMASKTVKETQIRIDIANKVMKQKSNSGGRTR